VLCALCVGVFGWFMCVCACGMCVCVCGGGGGRGMSALWMCRIRVCVCVWVCRTCVVRMWMRLGGWCVGTGVDVSECCRYVGGVYYACVCEYRVCVCVCDKIGDVLST
jgi:hypothetical protein